MRISETSAGGGQLPVLFEPSTLGFSATTYPTALRAFFDRFRVSAPVPITGISYFVGTASGNVDGGIYTSADGGVTLTKVVTSGSTAASGSSTSQTLALAATTLVPGVDYWRAFVADNTTITVLRGAMNTVLPGIGKLRLQKDLGALPLPASVSSLSTGTQLITLIVT